MSDEILTIRWNKNAGENEQLARDIWLRWKDDGIHKEMLINAIILQDGKVPVTDTAITGVLGQLADKLTTNINRLEKIEFKPVYSPQDMQTQQSVEFDTEFDDVMLSGWQE